MHDNVEIVLTEYDIKVGSGAHPILVSGGGGQNAPSSECSKGTIKLSAISGFCCCQIDTRN